MRQFLGSPYTQLRAAELGVGTLLIGIVLLVVLSGWVGHALSGATSWYTTFLTTDLSAENAGLTGQVPVDRGPFIPGMSRITP